MAQDGMTIRLSDNLTDAVRAVAHRNLRSANAQVAFYVIAGLRGDGIEPPDDGIAPRKTAPKAQAAAVGVDTAAPPPYSAAPKAQADAISAITSAQQPHKAVTADIDDVRQDIPAIIARIKAEVMTAQGTELSTTVKGTLGRLLPRFPNVVDLPSLRTIGADAWIGGGAGPGFCSELFPGDPGAVIRARRAKAAVQRGKHKEA